MKQATIREMTMDDYDQAIALWRSSEGIGLSDADSRDGIRRYLERNPGISCVAVADGEIVGAVLCGHDGRRGFLHHLAVRRDHRRRNLGSAMASYCLGRLGALGIVKCHIFVYVHNGEGAKFWSSTGWKHRDDMIIMSRVIDTERQ